jgi:hypothetical protein
VGYTHRLCPKQRGGPVRTPKESQRAKGTYILSREKGGISEDAEGKPASEGNSLPVKGSMKDKSGY